MAANMYRVGDYVYFETSSSQPYLIRRIEELNKTPNGNVEAKVVCFYRRRDISSSLIQLADKHQISLEEEQEADFQDLSEKERHQLKHRELFLSRQLDTLPATHIRGKCIVTLLNETESLQSYLLKEDIFFYSLVYDPQQKTLLADKGEIRVGSRYQADIPPMLKKDESDDRDLSRMEVLQYNPEGGLTDRQIDQFMIIARSVGTFARALDCSSSVRQPSLHMSAAASSRDVTLFHAMDLLHRNNYDIAKAISSLVPQAGPVLCRDQMEEWSASEANLFEEALEKYGKDFNDIRQDFLPWKSLSSIIEYYYMWKTTDRYVQQKRLKAAEAESKLKQVYIPNYNKPNPNQISNKPGIQQPSAGGRACESCYGSSYQWYSWGPANMQCRLCAACWIYWKKYGGLKMPTRLDGDRPVPNRVVDGSIPEGDRPIPNRSQEPQYACNVCNKAFYRQERLAAHMSAHRPYRCTISGCGKEFKLKAHLARHCQTVHGLTIKTSSGKLTVLKTRQAFFLSSTTLTRISRRICKDLLNARHHARAPFSPINIAAIKQECQVRLPDAAKDLVLKKKQWPTSDVVVGKLGIDTNVEKPACLEPAKPKTEPPRLSFPPPLSPFIHRTEPEKGKEDSSSGINTISPTILRKRGYEQHNGLDEQVGGRVDGQKSTIATKQLSATSGRVGMNGGQQFTHSGRSDSHPVKRRKRTNSMYAPEDVCFHATETTRKLRKQLTISQQRQIARCPWKSAPAKTLLPPTTIPQEPIVIDDD
ncbi:metastasis-associated protein MTA3-like isoform X2 [Ptychodera flava]|uniref:metastasis-associated protein MTA3-like isoform X2 n=1 Tax=Ptychodera flava TaxID=63121 RepID=UPI003969F769